MLLAKRQEWGIEILQGGAFILLVGFVYRYFGPSATTPPTPEVFGLLTVCSILLVATVNHTTKAKSRKAEEPEKLSKAQTQELVERLRGADWLQMEKVVSGLYARLGCATWRHSNIEGERNFSLVIERAGHKTAVMCKPWRKADVTSPEIIEFSTELKQAGMSHGVLVTMRECTAPAASVANTLGIDVVNREGLVHLFAACESQYRSELLAQLEDDRKYCPSCDQEMFLRTSTKGIGAGEEFWECSDSPNCRCTEPH